MKNPLKKASLKRFKKALLKRIKGLRRNKKSRIAKGNWNKECEEWLGKEHLAEEKRVLNEQHLSREDLARLYVICSRNWKLCMAEMNRLEKEVKRLQTELNLSRRD